MAPLESRHAPLAGRPPSPLLPPQPILPPLANPVRLPPDRQATKSQKTKSRTRGPPQAPAANQRCDPQSRTEAVQAMPMPRACHTSRDRQKNPQSPLVWVACMDPTTSKNRSKNSNVRPWLGAFKTTGFVCRTWPSLPRWAWCRFLVSRFLVVERPFFWTLWFSGRDQVWQGGPSACPACLPCPCPRRLDSSDSQSPRCRPTCSRPTCSRPTHRLLSNIPHPPHISISILRHHAI